MELNLTLWRLLQPLVKGHSMVRPNSATCLHHAMARVCVCDINNHWFLLDCDGRMMVM